MTVLATYPSSSGNGEYHIIAAAAGPYCDCMGWKTSKASPKTCKHLRDYAARGAQTTVAPPVTVKPRSDKAPAGMLAYDATKAPRVPWGDPAWVADVKLDGERKLAVFAENDCPTFYSRSGLSYQYPWASDMVLPSGTILDGELVEAGGVSVWGGGGRKQDEYRVFDVLQVGDTDLRGRSWTDRRAVLDMLVPAMDHPRVKLVPVLGVPDEAAANEVMAQGFEGVMLKRRDSTYQGARSWDWLKVKWTSTWDVIVTDMDGEPGVTGDFNLRYGWVSNGKLIVSGSLGVLGSAKDLYSYIGKVVEVKGWAFNPQTGAIRHPQMVRVRDDKSPADCRLEEQS